MTDNNKKAIAQVLLHIEDKNLLWGLNSNADVSPEEEINPELNLLFYDTDDEPARIYKSSLKCWMVEFSYRCKSFLEMGIHYSCLRQNNVLHMYRSEAAKLESSRSLIAICYELARKFNPSIAAQICDGKTVIRFTFSNKPPTSLYLWSCKGKFKSYLALTSILALPDDCPDCDYFINIRLENDELMATDSGLDGAKVFEYTYNVQDLLEVAQSLQPKRLTKEKDGMFAVRNFLKLGLLGTIFIMFDGLGIVLWFVHTRIDHLATKILVLEKRLNALKLPVNKSSYSDENIEGLLHEIGMKSNLDSITLSRDGNEIKYNFQRNQE